MKKIEGFLQKMGASKEKTSAYAEKIVKILAIVVVIIILLILSQLAVFYGIFVWIGTKISVLTGLDQFITKGIAFLLMAILFGTPLGSFIWSFTPVPQKNKKRKRAVFLIILAILSFAAFFASQNVYFNVRTGQAEKYYSIGVDGKYVFYSKPGYDPITGDELLPVTKEIIRRSLTDRSVFNYQSIRSNSTDYYQKTNENGEIEGMPRSAVFYPIVFFNNSNKNLYLCVTAGPDTNDKVMVYRISSKTLQSISLIEGAHYYAWVDVNGAQQGSRQLQKMYAPLLFYLDGQEYRTENSFLLEALHPKNGKVFLINENYWVSCTSLSELKKSEKLEKKEKFWKTAENVGKGVMITVLLTIVCFVVSLPFIGLARLIKKTNKISDKKPKK